MNKWRYNVIFIGINGDRLHLLSDGELRCNLLGVPLKVFSGRKEAQFSIDELNARDGVRLGKFHIVREL
jgi:hypothetical protein